MSYEAWGEPDEYVHPDQLIEAGWLSEELANDLREELQQYMSISVMARKLLEVIPRNVPEYTLLENALNEAGVPMPDNTDHDGQSG